MNAPEAPANVSTWPLLAATVFKTLIQFLADPPAPKSRRG
jgi:hypothetical protein